MSTSKKYFIFMVVGLVVILGGVFGYGETGRFFMRRYFATFTPPPAVISSATASAQTWKPYLTAVGTVIARQGVEVSADASGILTHIYFRAGQIVKADQPLVQLDARVDQQELKRLQAEQTLAKLTYERVKSLYAKKATSKSQLDEASAKLEEISANVARNQVLIDKKTIRAPFKGKIGISSLNVGQYISQGSQLVSLQAFDLVDVDFTLPEQDLNHLYPNQPVKLRVDVYPKRVFEGEIEAINATVNPRTHNILVRAVFPNPDGALYPGLFANLKILLPEQHNIITVPQTAVTYSLYGHSIYIIKSEGKDKKTGKPILRAHQVYVKTGERRGNQVAILSGVKAGDQVVSSGQLKLQDKSRVLINNSVTLPH